MTLDWEALIYRLKRRPVRVVEALVVLAGLAGVAIDPDAIPHIVVLLGLVFGGGEWAQTRTRPTVDDEVSENLARATNPRKGEGE